MATVKALGKLVAILAVVYVCFRYVGGFSARQSGVLTVLGWLVRELYESLKASRRTTAGFTPFCFSIAVKWRGLLSDFRLVRTEEDWQRLCQAMNKVPPEEYSLFRSGFLFTVISPPSAYGAPPGLTYFENRKRFVSDLNLSESITETKYDSFIRGEHPFFNHPAYAWLPEIYVRPVGDGYEIGLEVQLDWWKRLCEAGEVGDLAKLKSNPDYSCGATRLAIASLPFAEFGSYYQDNGPGSIKRQLELMDGQLKANEWERNDLNDPEVQDPWSHVEHKYFTVSHRVI